MTTDLQYVRRWQNLLHQESRAIAPQINLTAGSIVITYKQGTMTDPEMRSHLAILIQAAA